MKNPADNVTRLFYIDRMGISTEVLERIIEFNTTAGTIANIDEAYKVTNTNTDTLTFDAKYSPIDDAIILVYVSLNAEGNRTVEIRIGLKDSDRDGLGDDFEIAMGLDMLNPDTDGDKINDGAEYYKYGTDPNAADTDNDNLSDYEEIVIYNINPNIQDTDGDKISDYEEVKVYHSNPLEIDSDGDGLNDTLELIIGYNISIRLLNGTVLTKTVYLNASNKNTDNDTLSDIFEYLNLLDGSTDDTDGDNITDSEELALKLNATNQDTDYDGLSDWQELMIGTDPKLSDTDGNGLSDYEEVKI